MRRFVAVGHDDGVEERSGDLLSEQDGEEADQGEDLTKPAEGVGDQEMGDGEQPLDEGSPPGDVKVGLEVELD